MAAPSTIPAALGIRASKCLVSTDRNRPGKAATVAKIFRPQSRAAPSFGKRRHDAILTLAAVAAQPNRRQRSGKTSPTTIFGLETATITATMIGTGTTALITAAQYKA